MDLTLAIFLILIGCIIGFSMAALLFTLRTEKKEETAPLSPPHPSLEKTQTMEENPTILEIPSPALKEIPPTSEQPLKHPTGGPLGIFVRALQKMEIPRVEPALPSIVAQIDAILQERLKGTSLARRGVRLVEQSDQGMAIVIGLNRYDELDAVPDAEVQAAIRAAVAEWERRTSQEATSEAAQNPINPPDRENLS